MVTRDENDLLTCVGAGTAMGDLLRQYWTPVVLSNEVSAGDRTKRVRLMGEDLVVFRTKNGQPGLMAEHCTHRRASLYFGRIEDSCLRCAYHGWAYALDGQCIDMPNQVAGTRFEDKVRHPAYACRESGGVIWAYMGPEVEPPGLPDLEWALVPADHLLVTKFFVECNWLQAMEGGIDPAHVSFLHAPLDTTDDSQLRELDKAEAGFGLTMTMEKAPLLGALDTDYGMLIAAARNAGNGTRYWRITQFHMPFHTMPPIEVQDDPVYQAHIWVPSDDHNMINWCITWSATRPLTDTERTAMVNGLGIHILDYEPATNEAYGDIRLRSNYANDYLMDWEAHRTKAFFGIPGVGAQDRAIQESQGQVYDRTQETLGTADIGLVRVRRQLVSAALGLREGTPAPGLDPASYRIRPASVVVPSEASWSEAARKDLVSQVTS